MDLVLWWLGLSVLAGVLAGNKGRSGFGFFLLALVLSPLIGILGALIAAPSTAVEMEKAQRGTSDVYKRCPMCAETIRKEALKCRYCGADLANNQEKAAVPDYQPTSAAPVLNDAARQMGRAAASVLHASNPHPEREPTLDEILAREKTRPGGRA